MKEGEKTCKNIRIHNDCVFYNVNDENLKKLIISSTTCPTNANNIAFWASRNEPSQWGLLVKSFPPNSEFSSTKPTWQLGWVANEGKLRVSKNSIGMAEDICGGDFYLLHKIFNLVSSGQ